MKRTVLRGVIFMALALCLPARAKAADFSGNFYGIAGAAAMTLDLQDMKERVAGRLTLAGGQTYALTGERSIKGKIEIAEGTLRRGGSAESAAYFHMELRPLGVQFLFVPRKSDGKPDIDHTRNYSFVMRGVAPAPMAAAAPVKSAPGGSVDALRFIDEYKQWSAADVARLYAGLDESSRGLIELYDHASADLLWRVCSVAPPGMALQPPLDGLMERQGTDCAAYVALAEQAKASPLFPEFIRATRFQFELIHETILCSRSKSAPSKCADVSAIGAPLILKWRDASSIMRELLQTPSNAPAPVAALPQASGGKGAKLATEPLPLRSTITDEDVN